MGENGVDDNRRINEGKIVKKEEMIKGLKLFSSVARWIQAFGTPGFFLFLFLMAVFNSGLIGFQWFLGKYTDGKFPNVDYEIVLILGLVGVLLIAFTSTFAFSIGQYKASVNVYRDLLMSILRRPMDFFDTTAIGQVISRLMSDKESVDQEVGFFIQIVLFGVVQLVLIMLVVASTSPVMLVVFVLIMVAFVRAFKKRMILNTELKKVHNIAQAPVFSNISEIFNGASIVKSFGVEEMVRKNFELNMDRQLHSSLHLTLSELSIEFKSEQYGALLCLFTALSISSAKIFNLELFSDQETMGLALTQIVMINAWLLNNIYPMMKLMRGLASYERMLEWTDSTNLEAAATKPDDPKDWPASGRIEARNLTARYRQGLPRVLKGLDFVVENR